MIGSDTTENKTESLKTITDGQEVEIVKNRQQGFHRRTDTRVSLFLQEERPGNDKSIDFTNTSGITSTTSINSFCTILNTLENILKLI